MAEVPPLPSGAELSLQCAAAEWPDSGSSTDDTCSADVWPAAAALCRWLRAHAEVTRHASVLELGAGLGAVGLYAAGLGASRVVLTERDDKLRPLAANVALNTHLLNTSELLVTPLSWGGPLPNLLPTAHAPPSRTPHAFDLVLGSDVTYKHEAVHELAHTLDGLLRARTPTAVAILAHEHRAPRRDFGRAMSTWDEHDGALAAFRAAAHTRGLTLRLLDAERPVPEVRGAFRRWTADISIMEVAVSSDGRT